MLVEREGLAELRGIYTEFTGQLGDFAAIAHDKKIAVAQEALGSDVNRLTSLFVEICENNRNQRDYTRAEIRRAIREMAACFKIYRTYVVPAREEITEEDETHIAHAAECARLKRQDIDGGLFDFLRDVLTCVVTGKQETEFLLRFQQFTGPVMAKGVEDTAFYCFNRLIGMNEVGSDPGRDGLSVERVPRLLREDAGHPSAHDDHAVDPRHQAQRRRSRPPRRLSRAARPLRCRHPSLVAPQQRVP